MERRKPLKQKQDVAKAVSAGAKKPRVLVLGVSGMLGSMVFRSLSARADMEVYGTVRAAAPGTSLYSFDAAAPVFDERPFKKYGPDFVINCIGIIKPYCKDDDEEGVARAISVNARFPHDLASCGERLGFRTIQIATDCVYSGGKGSYTEADTHDALDVYGKSKSLGEVRRPFFLNIRTSIIGPEEKAKLSLLEWFLAQKEGSTIKGFAHHRWNGVTTLQFAELVEEIVRRGPVFFDGLVKVSPVHHFVPNEAVDKYELMKIFVDIFGRALTVERVDTIGAPVDRTLSSRFELLPSGAKIPMREAISQLSRYMKEHRIFPYA
jgi:dTDP-4-dehydrorhamnose reductase